MDPPPLIDTSTTTFSLPDTLDFPPPPPPPPKLRFICSYGGHILPRSPDKTLTYVGGETRIILIDRSTSLSSLATRLSSTLFNHAPFILKYQLPTEDLDSLISVNTDEDFDNLIDEYDRINAVKSRLRLFLFPLEPNSDHLMKNWSSNSNGLLFNQDFSHSASINSLLGLDGDGDGGVGGSGSGDVNSVSDSLLMETYSSFGSASSSPQLANLPPVKGNVEDSSAVGGGRRGLEGVGIEEQFARMGIGGGGKKQDDGFMVVSSQSQSQPPFPAAGVAVGGAVILGESQNRVVSDDERSEQGVPIGYGKPPQPQMQFYTVSSQMQPKSSAGSGGLPSPDSISSDGSPINVISRPNSTSYQDQVVQLQSGTTQISAIDGKINMSESNPRGQFQQQVQDSGYILQYQFDQPQSQQPVHFIHDGTHYINHQSKGTMPLSAYYPVYSLQQRHQLQHHHQQLDHQYPMYYVSARQPQFYNNMPVQQSSVGETTMGIPSTRSQMPPPTTYNPMRNAPIAKSEMSAAGMYRQEATNVTPQFVQVASTQNEHQYVGYPQVHHPSQSTSAGTVNYAYKYPESAHAQVYYTQPLAQTVPSQYQTMTVSTLPEASAQFPSGNIKQQIRASQQI